MFHPTFPILCISLLVLSCPAARAQADDQWLQEMTNMNQKIDALGTAVAELERLQKQAIPEGAVVAFKGPCPAVGWKLYLEASGRFLIGAATDSDVAKIPNRFAKDDGKLEIAPRKLGDPGGSQKKILSAENIPRVESRIFAVKAPVSDSFNVTNVVPCGGGCSSVPAIAGPYGAATTSPYQILSPDNKVPFDLLPPYVAVSFCERSSS